LLAGTDTWPYHLTNVMLHFFVGGLVYFILRKALELTGSARREASLLALFGSLVFLFHPLQTEAVAYIASRSESLSTLCAYGALALLLAVGDAPIGWRRAALILGLLAAGTLVKEHVVAMAAVVLLVDWWLKGRGADRGAGDRLVRDAPFGRLGWPVGARHNVVPLSVYAIRGALDLHPALRVPNRSEPGLQPAFRRRFV
jgi:hypothetical protein